jgi:penicillin-binding protein 1A
MTTMARTAAAFLVVTVLTPVVTAGVALAASIFLPLPATLPDAKPTIASQISHVYDADGNEIALFREFETSIPVERADIPQVLKDAVVAAEDRSFYQHGGVDLRGTLRALWADVRSGGAVQGGSTITQQYVKNAYTGNEQSISRKIHEAILASQLDRQLSKEDILFKYLSTIYLGEGAYGVGAAAETYFRKPVSQLTLSEAALLAGLIPAPSRYSPRVNPDLAEEKRLIVLDAMLDVGSITQEVHDAAVAEKPTVFPPQQLQSTQPWFTDYLARFLEAHLPGGRDQLYRGGLRIYTTLDPRSQLLAQAAVLEQLDGTDPELQMALVAVEPPTGFVRAIVGGRDFNTSQVNSALGADGGGSDRQPGSAFKPFVLATAFDQGVSPSKRYSGAPHETPGKTFENSGGASYGNLDLRTATWKSVNTVFTRLIEDVGVEDTMAMASRLGVSMPAFDPALYGLSVALGAVDVSPLEMASAYGVFANHGRRAEPTPVFQVVGPDGGLVLDYSHAPEQAQQVVKEEVADNVTDVLQGVLTSGTAAGKGINRPAAGKTGTTDDYGNAWFVGYTPTLSTSVWMGYRNPSTPLEDIHGRRGGVVGGSFPAETWQQFMKAALENVPATQFADPAPIRPIADVSQREARQGFDAGEARYPSETDPGGPYVYEIDPPSAELPTTTSSTTTSTTTPGGGGGGGGSSTTTFTLLPP